MSPLIRQFRQTISPVRGTWTKPKKGCCTHWWSSSTAPWTASSSLTPNRARRPMITRKSLQRTLRDLARALPSHGSACLSERFLDCVTTNRHEAKWRQLHLNYTDCQTIYLSASVSYLNRTPFLCSDTVRRIGSFLLTTVTTWDSSHNCHPTSDRPHQQSEIIRPSYIFYKNCSLTQQKKMYKDQETKTGHPRWKK